MKIRQSSPKRQRAQRIFRVLLLSTERDLGPTRRVVAEHLRRSLGVDVQEGFDIVDTAPYDTVILFQAWCWDGGQVARIWDTVKDDRRAAFLVDENSDWPPRRLVEISADLNVREFRGQLRRASTFDKLENLPEAVTKVIIDKLQALHGENRLGLMDWEKSYLDFRLPAWRSGRTALSQPHLFDAEQAQELYQPDLYVALDGISPNWVRGDDGHPQKISKRRQQRDFRIDTFENSSRVRLAKWLCARDIPRIALVGAPGGGKTIFLTRIAATLGNACLGRQIDLEPDLDVDRIRRDVGLPIPIVLEATRLAQGDVSRVDALLDAILAEISAAGTRVTDRKQIEEGLKEGRYLLLIDALDEIADWNIRSNVLTLIKGISGPEMFFQTRLILTTRSARYTGRLRFGPELETIEVASLDADQVKELCSNWSSHRQRDAEYRDALMSAVVGLSETLNVEDKIRL